jgi:tetratricopeptide (TPR) repeat protein
MTGGLDLARATAPGVALARKAPHQGHATAPTEPRIHRAVNEGRFQQALELAKQLHKQSPTPAHLELLKRAYLGRAKQLREQGHGRDAVITLEAALRIDAAPAWLEQVARETALAGGVRQALALLDRLPPDTPGAGAIRAHAADAALLLDNAGREQLPAALQAEFDRVRLAFQQVEQGQDEAAKATLQELGLRSPFLEWKVLLRGFQAYYHGDDVRALENWQRLAPDRVPARVAAPFRCQIDPPYRAAQPPATQAAMQTQLDRAQGSVLAQELRRLRQAMSGKETLAAAFRQAEALLPLLKQHAPHLVSRLATCLYWTTTETGPDDIARFHRVFGAQPLDPHFHRLRALAYDRARDAAHAHSHWLAYEKDLADHPELFPDGQAQRARALLWLHLGRNAAGVPSKKKLAKLPRHLRDHPGLPGALDPPPEKCFEKAAELAPDQLEPYEELFKFHVGETNYGKASRAAKRLLERFPDHAPTLEALGDVRLRQKKYQDALALFQRALRGKPLDRDLRRRVGTAHLFQARADLEAGRFDDARQHYQHAAALEDAAGQWSILARWAACEFKAGDDPRAEELLGRAAAAAPHPLVVAFRMLTEAIRLKLPKALKARFEREYKAGLAAPPTPAAAAQLAEFLADLKGLGVSYPGQKTHEGAVLKYINKGQSAKWDAREVEAVVRALLKLRALAPARRFLTKAARRFRDDPVFPFLEAVSYFYEGPDRMPHYQVRWLLNTAEELAQALPPGERRAGLLDEVHKHQEMLNAFDPFGPVQNIFESLFDLEDDDDDYDDDDYDGGW